MFNHYSTDNKRFVISTEMPYFCEQYYSDENKKCQNYYSKLSNNEYSNGLHKCPYGFSSYKSDEKIYSCLIVNGHSDLTKVYSHLKIYKQKPRDFSSYTVSQIRNIISHYESTEKKQKIMRLTIHDLKNATKHFMDLADNVKQDEALSKKIEEDDELFSAIEGYSLIQYRLDYHDQLLNSDITREEPEKRYTNFHRIIMKLSKLMKYRGIKKDVTIEFHGWTKNIFYCNRDMYLASFIFIENAIKYALQFSTIKITFRDTGRDTTNITISNQCSYISAEEMENIYNDGFRSESARSSSKGSGLGLGLAKRICDRSGVEMETTFIEMDENSGEFNVSLTVKK